MDGNQRWIRYAIYGGMSGVIANFGLVFILIVSTGDADGSEGLFQIGSIIGGVVGLVGGLLGGRIGERYNRGYLGAVLGGALLAVLGFFLIIAFLGY